MTFWNIFFSILVQRQGLAAFQKMFDKIFNIFTSMLFNHVVKLSCKSHFGFKDPATQINPFRSPFWHQNKGCHFGAKMSQTIWYGSTHFNSGSGFPDPDRLTCCTIYRCLFVEIHLLRNQISLCQCVFYYKTLASSSQGYGFESSHSRCLGRINGDKSSNTNFKI